MSLADELDRLLPHGKELAFGELTLSRRADGTYEARHRDDTDAGPLNEIASADELRDLAKYDASGHYRPLKTAPGLVPGWRARASDAAAFLKQLDAVYPALFATWIAYQHGGIEPVPLRRTLNRQTGMYRFAGTITPEMAAEIRTDLCQAGCLRRIAWSDEENDPTPPIRSGEGEIPLLCTEACTFAVTRARELAKAAHEAKASASKPEVGD